MFTKHLDFQLDELKFILVDDILNAASEDDVVETVLKSAERKYGENTTALGKNNKSIKSAQTEEMSSPSQCLAKILECARYLLTSCPSVYLSVIPKNVSC